MDFTGKRILITDASSGLGRLTAGMFHAAGARVAIHGQSADSVAATIREIGADRLVPAVGDINDVTGTEALVAAAVSSLGGLDGLVVNAAYSPRARTMEVTEDIWDAAVAANLRSAVFAIKAALPALRSSQGNIVVVSSAAALMAGPTDQLMFSTTMAGLLGMARNLAIELAPYKVRINSVAPGYLDTPELAAASSQRREQVQRFVAASIPLKRIGTLAECASAILYLASEGASYCSGTVIGVDGGAYANASWGSAS